MSDVKWYCRGEVGEKIRNAIDAFIDDFMSKDEFASELDSIGLSLEEQNEIIKEEIRNLEFQIADSTQDTIH